MVNIIKEIEEKVKEGEEEIKEVFEKGEHAVKKVVEEVEEKLGIKPKKKLRKSVSKKAESITSEKDIKERKRILLKKAKELEEKFEKPKTEELKEKVKIKKRDMLIPLEEYIKVGIYLGTKVVTPNMKPFVYRRRADGLAIFNTNLIDEKLREGIGYLSEFAPEDVVLVCKREAGWKAAKKFGEITGIRVFTKKYPTGLLTNKQLPDFFENELTIITDHWVDKNALNDTLNVHKKVLMICDTNNFSKGANQIILGNNKSSKSLGLIFYLLINGYCKARGIKADIPQLEWWTGEVEEEGIKQKSKEIFAEPGVAE